LFSSPSNPFSSFLFPFPNLCSLLNPSSCTSLPAYSTPPPPPALTCTMYPSVCTCMYLSVVCKSMSPPVSVSPQPGWARAVPVPAFRPPRCSPVNSTPT
jgi:hypothetical protein